MLTAGDFVVVHAVVFDLGRGHLADGRHLEAQLQLAADVRVALEAGFVAGLDGAQAPADLARDDARIGVDLSQLFEDASKVVGHPGTVNLMRWLTRAPADRTMESMGFMASEEAGGFRYRLVG